MKQITLSYILLGALSLQASTIDLEKVTVTTATKSPQNIQNITSNVDVILSEEIQDRGYNTISDALRAHAGIAMTNNGGLGKATSIFVRGFDSKRVLVLVDGVRYNDPASVGGAHFEHILMENVEKIEIVKGAQSGIWGADASAGVINIITKKATKEGLGATLFAEYGSYNTIKYGLNSSYKQNNFDTSLDVERLTSDNFTTKVPAGADMDDFEDDNYENTTANLKLGYNISDKDRVEAFFNYIDTDSEYDGYDKNATKAANDTKSKATLKEQFYGLSYTRSEGKNSTKIYANRSDFSRDNISAFGTSPFDGSVDEVGLNTAIDYTKDGHFTAGVDYKNFTHTLDLSQTYGTHDYHDKSYANTGIFLSNSNTFKALSAGDTIFSQALRYDDFDNFDNKFTYKLGLKHFHKNIEGFWTSANYATAYNVPSLYQLFHPKYGNKDLNPEETTSYDITANYKGFGVTYFHSDIDDMIEYKMTDPATYAGGYFNIAGKSTLSGVEVAYANTLRDVPLSYSFNYTYLKAEDRDGKKLARRPKNSANLTLDYFLERAHLGTQVSYTGKRTKSKYDANPSVEYDAYTLVDVTADYDLLPALNIYARVNNLLDKEYESVSGYATAQRAYYLGFRYKMK